MFPSAVFLQDLHVFVFWMKMEIGRLLWAWVVTLLFSEHVGVTTLDPEKTLLSVVVFEKDVVIVLANQ